ncbi:cytochrome P450 [Oscillatoria sp. FACHB-1406]|uniref:cytochrome P450 n=1 Tax=Oscillatoria sp. FACHB-1406 TaxID=2692846 RepID=UPI001683CDC8|nr:cytochrome P450 [Oscillatoria sp. FACHB-1406]MBD2578205.1 cytochrome P450 [Oscillatoria sp. FACHB-1406]
MTSQTKTLEKLPLPPGNSGLPFVGETFAFLFDRDFSKKRLERYGKIFKTNVFGSSTAIMVGADANQFLFKNEEQYVRSTWPKSTKILLGPASLAVRSGEFHTSRRKLLFQAFQPRAIASYSPTIERITNDYLARWERQETLTWYPELRNYTFDIAGTLFMGVDNTSQTSLGHLFETWCEGLFSIPISLPWTKFGKALQARKGLLQGIEKIIRQRQQENKLGNDALGILLQARDEAGNQLTLEELKDQVLLLLFAGHETLTSAIASFCLLTAQHPQILERIRAELKANKIASPLTAENLKSLTYLDRVLKEVLRLIPPVGGGFREAIAPFEFNGYRIPQGWQIQYQILQTHKEADLYPDSEQFDPDRFSPENSPEKQKNFGYIPFGGGLRECLGKEFAKLEMRIFAALLVRDYQWELLPEQDLSLVAIPTPHPRDGLKVRFSRC